MFNYATYNGVPIITYGLIGLTASMLGLVTLNPYILELKEDGTQTNAEFSCFDTAIQSRSGATAMDQSQKPSGTSRIQISDYRAKGVGGERRTAIDVTAGGTCPARGTQGRQGKNEDPVRYTSAHRQQGG